MSENNADLGSEGTNTNPDFASQPYGASQPHAASQPYGASQPHAASAQPAPSPWSATGAAQPPSTSAGLGAGTAWTQATHEQAAPWSQTASAPRQTSGWRKAAVGGMAAVAIALGAGGVGGFVGYAMHGDSGSPLQTISSGNNGGGAAPVIDRSSLASIAAGIQPTVVDIKTGSGEGSGVVISGDGYIVTNNHVVEGARGSTVQVNFNSGKQVQAKIVGTDPKTDLAVVKADVTGLTHAQWGDSDSVRVGDTVLAIGSPLGLQGSVTAGIISALHRTITVGGDQQTPFDTGNPTTIGDAIQTDAPINPGNSGGALVNTQGKVIGINSAIATGGSSASGNIGLGFAISANKAKSVTDAIIHGGKVSHPYLGISVGDAQNGGAQIQQVVPGSPADKAGLKAGDVVTKINDRTIAGSEDLVGAVQASKVGASVTLTVNRNGSETTTDATVGEAP